MPRHILLALAALMAAPLAALPAHAAPASHDVRYANGAVPLAAELMLPSGDGPHPAVVIAQGSGASDRSNDWARAVAKIFLDHGVAVLLTDKRGSGASGGDWRDAAFATLAEDTRAGIAWLRTRGEIDPDRIGIAGLSQGGKYAPLVAASDARTAFVVAISSDALTYGEQAFHEMANMAREGGAPEPAIAQGIALAAAAARFSLADDWPAYAAARDRAAQGPAAAFLAAFPATPDDPRWAFWRANGAFDAMAYWAIVPQPALILLGEEDERNNVAVAETVHRLTFGFAQARKTDQRIRVLPGVGHDVGIMSDPAPAAAAIGDFLRAYGLCGCDGR